LSRGERSGDISLGFDKFLIGAKVLIFIIINIRLVEVLFGKVEL